jgi:hypothetical protein
MGESAQLNFASKISGEFLPIRANFAIVQPKNLLIWGNFAQIERNPPEIFGAKLDCADSPISGEKNNYCVVKWPTAIIRPKFRNSNTWILAGLWILSIVNFKLMMNIHFPLFQLPGNLF